MNRTVEERVDLLERHVRFGAAIDGKVDRVLSEFGSHLRQIHALAGATNTAQFECESASSGRSRDLESKVAALGQQCRQLDEKLVDIDVKLDQVVRLLAPEPMAGGNLTHVY